MSLSDFPYNTIIPIAESGRVVAFIFPGAMEIVQCSRITIRYPYIRIFCNIELGSDNVPF
jgi:hypothetical protein